MDFTQDRIIQIIEETKAELLEPVDNSSVLADMTHKLFNQGVSLMCCELIYKILTNKEG